MNDTKHPQLGRFELRAELGRGYHGRVFLAWDPQLERQVAIKLLLGAQGDDDTRTQFMAEARAVARLAHPNVIPLYEVGMQGKTPFLVFEYVEGAPLKAEIQRRGAMVEDEALPLFRQALDGMAAAHELDVAHLDLSPNNLMFDRSQRVRVMDFGLARFASRPLAGKGGERMHGTPRYMSPEHFSGGNLDRRTDVYALGLILFEMLAGQPAAVGEGLTKVRAMILQGNFDWERLRTLGVSPPLVQVLRDALARDPGARFQAAGDFRQVLAEILASQALPTVTDLALQFLLRRLQRRPEFPAFSNSILEINRMTSDESQVGVRDLADVIQRDFSLTNRLMKIGNSAFFDRGGGGVNTVAQAINLIGTRMIRLLCNGLVVFERLQNGQLELQDALVSSFVTGLIARNLGQRLRRDLADEAFVCGLFNRLGRNLALYYLPEEWEDIKQMVDSKVPPIQAQKRVLGTTLSALGAGVAGAWKFPMAIVDSMTPVLSEPNTPAPDTALLLRLIAQLANELCEAAYSQAPGPLDAAENIACRYRGTMALSALALREVLSAALAKFVELAPALGVAVGASGFCQRAEQFIAAMREAEAERMAAPPPVA